MNFPDHFKDRIITTVERDKAGLLWLVTHDGLYRYDGYEIIPFHPDDQPALGMNSINTIFADHQNRLWVGRNSGLNCLDLETWTFTDIKAPDFEEKAGELQISTIGQGDDGTIYAGSVDGRLYRVLDDRLDLILDLRHEVETSRHTSHLINFTDHTYPGEIWIGTTSGKLVRLRKEGGKFAEPEFYNPEGGQRGSIKEAVFDPSGTILAVFPGKGLYALNKESGIWKELGGDYGTGNWERQFFLTGVDDNKAVLLTDLSDSGTNVLFVYDFLSGEMTRRPINFPESLQGSRYSWVKKAGDNIYLSLSNQINELVISESVFPSFLSDVNSLNSIRCMYKHPEGDLYVGSYKYGFMKYDEEKGTREVISQQYVYTILPWNEDSLLLGTEGGGIMWYEIATNKATRIIPLKGNPDDVPMGSHITMLELLNEESILIGLYEGLFRYDARTNMVWSLGKDQLGTTKINDCVKIGDEVIIATDSGLFKWNKTDGGITYFSKESSVLSGDNAIYCIERKGNMIWAGTDGHGLVITDLEGRVAESIRHEDGLASDVVFSMAVGEKWVIAGSYNGLSVVDRTTNKIRNYSKLDQLPAEEFNRSAVFNEGASIYMGTTNGIIRIETQKLKDLEESEFSIPVYITNLAIGAKNSEVVHDFTLPYVDHPRLTIKAGTPYFSVVFGNQVGIFQSLEYFYRLRDNEKWNPLGLKNEITFVGMKPGSYELQVAAKLSDGLITPALLSVPLRINPAFHQTFWFVLIIILIVAAILWAIFRYREKVAEKQRLLRLQIAGDLHDEVGSSLAGITMMADFMLQGNQDKSVEYLERIAGSGRKAMTTMSDIVWSVDPRNNDQLSLIDRMQLYADNTLGPAEIKFKFEIPDFLGKKWYVSQEVRQNVMLIFKEALTNICKHSQANQVDIAFKISGNIVTLVIADDGVGIQDRKVRGSGLRNMRMRADMIGAELSFPSVEKGVTIMLEFKF